MPLMFSYLIFFFFFNSVFLSLVSLLLESQEQDVMGENSSSFLKMAYPRAKGIQTNFLKLSPLNDFCLSLQRPWMSHEPKKEKLRCKQHREVTHLFPSQTLSIILSYPMCSMCQEFCIVSSCLYNQDQPHLTIRETWAQKSYVTFQRSQN